MLPADGSLQLWVTERLSSGLVSCSVVQKGRYYYTPQGTTRDYRANNRRDFVAILNCRNIIMYFPKALRT